MEKYRKFSTYLSYLLRHHPEDLELAMDKNGYVFVDELIEKVNNTKKWKDFLTLDILKEIVRTDNKGRYTFSEDGLKIRAAQGHSFYVDTLKEGVPTGVLYHGTAKKFLDSIMENGLKSMSREYVHLSKDIETALNVGMRHAKTKENVVLLEIDTKAMLKDGLKLHVSDNGVWLAREVAPKYFKIVEF